MTMAIENSAKGKVGRDALFVSLVFLYSLLAGLILQKGVLPVYFPDRSTDGLLHGLDGVTFHEMAVQQADKIREQGWSAWEWDPGWSANQPVGWVSAIYVVAGNSPGWVLPLNALVHAVTAILLLLFLRQLGFRGWAVYAGALPLLYFPSTLTWVAQIHKDGFFILGFLSVLLGTLWIFQSERWNKVVYGMILLFLGMVAIALVREYGVFLLAVALVCALLVAFLVSVSPFNRGVKLSWKRCLPMGLALLVSIPLAGFKEKELGDKPHSVRVVDIENVEKAMDSEVSRERKPSFHWETSDWLPGFVDRSFHRLAYNREVFLVLFPDSGSILDRDRELVNAYQVLLYAPKAWMYGILAPFPTEWLLEGSSPTGTIQRRVAGLEMMIAYFSFVGLLLYLFRNFQPSVILIIVTCLFLILPFAISIPAVGSLYRLRYGPFALLIGIGLAWWVHKIQQGKLSDSDLS